jgi:hypothetical protein
MKRIVKRMFFVLGFVAGISVLVFSLEEQEYSDKESVDSITAFEDDSDSPVGTLTFDFVVSATLPSTIDITDRISAERFALGFGLGYHFTIIDKIFAPGLYLEYGFGGPIIIFEDSSSEMAVAYDGYGSIGLRAYNLFTVARFGIKPFFGFSYIGNAEIKQNNKIIHEGFGLWSWIAGVMVAYKFIGFEYAFCAPDFNNIIPFPYKYYHRISFLLHVS